jgi:hypothetical protein
MLISVKYDFVFLCTPKCASTSIEAMLRPYADIALQGPNHFRHTNLRDYIRYIRPYVIDKAGVATIETICLVREPMSWLDSWYRFRARHELRDPHHASHHHSTADVSFEDFVRAFVSEEPPAFAAGIGSQFDFVKDDMDAIGVDTIFRYENVEDVVAYMSRRIGKTLTLPRRNVSPNDNHRSDAHERARYLKRKLAIRLRLRGYRGAPPRPVPEIPRELTGHLERFLERDFALYESVKRSSPLSHRGEISFDHG